MVFDPSTSHVYALMTHKVQELYWQVFNQVFFMTKWKMQVRTYKQFRTGYDEHAGTSFWKECWWRKARRLFLPPEAGLEKVSY